MNGPRMVSNPLWTGTEGPSDDEQNLLLLPRTTTRAAIRDNHADWREG